MQLQRALAANRGISAACFAVASGGAFPVLDQRYRRKRAALAARTQANQAVKLTRVLQGAEVSAGFSDHAASGLNSAKDRAVRGKAHNALPIRTLLAGALAR